MGVILIIGLNMKIAINAQAASKENKTGVENFTLNLLLALQKYDKANRYILFSPKKITEIKESKNMKVNVIPALRMWHRLRLPIALKSAKFDIYFEPSYMLPPFPPKKSIIFIHDLASKRFPEAYSLSERILLDQTFKGARDSAKSIIFASESTKKDFKKFYSGFKGISKVIYQAGNETLRSVKKKKVMPYILCVGRIEYRKNQLNLIRTYKILRDKYKIKQKLIIVGSPGNSRKDVELEIKSSKSCNKDIKILSGIDNHKLAELYANADAFIYPSLFEGFGIPILEAFSFKIPVIASLKSSLPEVAGDAALYFDPTDPTDMAKQIHRVLSDKTRALKLIDKGTKRLSLFTWEKTAKEFIDLFKKTNKSK